MAKMAKPCASERAAGMPREYYALYSLMHTLQGLECHTDAICGLVAEIQQTGKVSARVRREMAALLQDVPLRMLEDELYELAGAVEQAA
jgi:hypothetical protein